MLPFASSFTSIVAMAKSSFALTGAAAFAYTSIISSSASTKLHCSTDQRCQPPTSYPLVRTLQKCIWAMCLSTTLDSYVVILISFRNFANLKSNLIMTVNTPRKHNLNPGERMFSRLCLSHLPNLPPLGVSFRHISDLPIQHVPQLMNLVCFARIVCFWSGLKSFQILQEVLPQCILTKNWVEEVVQSRSPNLCALLSVSFGIDPGNEFLSDALARVTGARSNESSTFTVATATLGWFSLCLHPLHDNNHRSDHS